MPHYEMRDAFGMMYRLSTQDRDLAQRWFDEWLPRLYPADMDADYGLPVMSVWPMQFDGRQSADWPTDTRYIRELFTIPRDPSLALAAIDQQRAEIDEQIRKAHANGT